MKYIKICLFVLFVFCTLFSVSNVSAMSDSCQRVNINQKCNAVRVIVQDKKDNKKDNNETVTTCDDNYPMPELIDYLDGDTSYDIALQDYYEDLNWYINLYCN